MEAVRHVALVAGGAVLAHLSMPLAASIEMRTLRQVLTVLGTTLAVFLLLASLLAMAMGVNVSEGMSITGAITSGLLLGFAAQRTISKRARSARTGWARSPTVQRSEPYIV